MPRSPCLREAPFHQLQGRKGTDGEIDQSDSTVCPVSTPSRLLRSTLAAEFNSLQTHHRFRASGEHPEWPYTLSNFPDGRDLLPLMYHPLQSSPMCERLPSQKQEHFGRSRQTVPAHSHTFIHSSRLETSGRPHSPPTSASACLLSPVISEQVKRHLHFVDERNNGPSQTLVQSHQGAIDKPAVTLRVRRLERHPRSGPSFSWMQIVMYSARSTCKMRTLETIIRLIGHVSSPSTRYPTSQYCS